MINSYLEFHLFEFTELFRAHIFRQLPLSERVSPTQLGFKLNYVRNFDIIVHFECTWAVDRLNVPTAQTN